MIGAAPVLPGWRGSGGLIGSRRRFERLCSPVDWVGTRGSGLRCWPVDPSRREPSADWELR
jgi:hypothetical protein